MSFSALTDVFPGLRREAAELRALTVRQPWAACIASSRKLVENRTWPTRYRGPLAIHSAAARDTTAPGLAIEAYNLAPRPSWALSAILAVAELTGCHEYKPGCCDTPWAEKGAGTWHWTLANVRALAEPVECAGRLSVWRPKPETVAAVLAQMGGV